MTWRRGWGRDLPGAPAWRLLTVDDLGARVGSSEWTVEPSPVQGYSIRLAKAAGSGIVAYWPLGLTQGTSRSWRMAMRQTSYAGSGSAYVGLASRTDLAVIAWGALTDTGTGSTRFRSFRHAFAADGTTGSGISQGQPYGDPASTTESYWTSCYAGGRIGTASGDVAGHVSPVPSDSTFPQANRSQAAVVSSSGNPTEEGDVLIATTRIAAGTLAVTLDLAIWYPASRPGDPWPDTSA